MSTIAKDQVVLIHYTLTGDGGEVLDSSRDGEPLAYLHGHGNIIPGLEAALEGASVGDALEVDVSAEDGYGLRDEERMVLVPRTELPSGFDVPEGEMVRAQGEDGQVMFLQVVENQEEAVLFDGNHPLAGQNLHFSVEVVELRAASADELSHGHVHGPGGHHH